MSDDVKLACGELIKEVIGSISSMCVDDVTSLDVYMKICMELTNKYSKHDFNQLVQPIADTKEAPLLEFTDVCRESVKPTVKKKKLKEISIQTMKEENVKERSTQTIDLKKPKLIEVPSKAKKIKPNREKKKNDPTTEAVLNTDCATGKCTCPDPGIPGIRPIETVTHEDITKFDEEWGFMCSALTPKTLSSTVIVLNAMKIGSSDFKIKQLVVSMGIYCWNNEENAKLLATVMKGLLQPKDSGDASFVQRRRFNLIFIKTCMELANELKVSLAAGNFNQIECVLHGLSKMTGYLLEEGNIDSDVATKVIKVFLHDFFGEYELFSMFAVEALHVCGHMLHKLFINEAFSCLKKIVITEKMKRQIKDLEIARKLWKMKNDTSSKKLILGLRITAMVDALSDENEAQCVEEFLDCMKDANKDESRHIARCLCENGSKKPRLLASLCKATFKKVNTQGCTPFLQTYLCDNFDELMKKLVDELPQYLKNDFQLTVHSELLRRVSTVAGILFYVYLMNETTLKRVIDVLFDSENEIIKQLGICTLKGLGFELGEEYVDQCLDKLNNIVLNDITQAHLTDLKRTRRRGWR